MKTLLTFLKNLFQAEETEFDFDKSLVLEMKADKTSERQKYSEAEKIYFEALQYNPNRIELYDKLIALQEKKKENWEEEDFAIHVTLTMRRKEILDPKFKRIHSRALPEAEEIKKMILEILKTKDAQQETQLVEQIVSHGEIALYPLIDFIISLKESSANGEKKN